MLSYAITDPSILSFDSLHSYFERIAKKADMLLYRDKQNNNYAEDANEFVKTAKTYPFGKILLHNDISLAVELQADGIHLGSDQIERVPFVKEKGLFVVVSTHTLAEAQKAEALGADMVTYSPIFDTPNKGKPLGLDKLSEVSSVVNIPVVALGGILTEDQIEACQKAGAKGFASIRYFKS